MRSVLANARTLSRNTLLALDALVQLELEQVHELMEQGVDRHEKKHVG